ncbi:SAM-dependent methyltransferase [Paracoccus laeviglucosivorans]|uniref:Cyclopropane-fatty-acyl-phospholipid synthase n=1 Tax=Paracoccus laeviglucosivorans TaxID=1197861 RepID=A0A521FCT5_9RHOB|nr:cyclopropane-fatty-acyl-phospholipid synthase family protein [Paracoccus laeviglucosivorans]SMO94002.1 cyclopropane-fatty-acyl-phospholipid synthase [Paracoccus laeviglucosivorans]
MGLATRIMQRRFLTALQGIRHGRLRLTTPEGHVHHFGDEGEQVELHIHDWAFLPRMAARGDVGLGESWIDGHWSTPSLEALLTLAIRNLDHLSEWANAGILSRLRMQITDRVVRLNTLRGSSRNIRAHYDVGNEFYQLWLDRGMTYSSALFAPGDDDLEQAQRRKNARILSQLGAGETVLEIGCGWGGFAEAAADRGRQVTGLTLSHQQKGYADARLDGRAQIRLQDYRHVQGRFDNIVSVEMIEAVGERYWPIYFATLKARLAEGGRAVLQAITIPDAEFSVYRKRSDFIRQHSFPGGMLPCNAVIVREAARAGLVLRDTFAFGNNYARTCRIWAERMLAERDRIRRYGYDERFIRAWQYYLEACAATFATKRTDVVQVTLSHA